jgi:hypothetical protein
MNYAKKIQHLQEFAGYFAKNIPESSITQEYTHLLAGSCGRELPVAFMTPARVQKPHSHALAPRGPPEGPR